MSDQAMRPSRQLPGTSYVRLDEMTWPDPTDPCEVEWRLRYGTASREDLLSAASFMHAYRELVWMPESRRRTIIRGLRQAVGNDPAPTYPECIAPHCSYWPGPCGDERHRPTQNDHSPK